MHNETALREGARFLFEPMDKDRSGNVAEGERNTIVIPAVKRMLHPERCKAGTQVEKPLL